MFEWLFGNAKTTSTVVDSISSGLDKLIFTDEEKSDANQKGVDLFIKYQEATQPQNVARRLVALIVTSIWAALILLGIATYPINLEFSQFILSVLQTVVTPSFLVIISFYFWKRLKVKS